MRPETARGGISERKDRGEGRKRKAQDESGIHQHRQQLPTVSTKSGAEQ